MIRFYLIRHGKTYGNTMRRYIGTTDEPLCEEGIRELREKHFPQVKKVFASPMRRCLETARILYPGQEPKVIEQLAECDFGAFENKNAEELSGDPGYRKWIDSNGTLPFPGGESREAFIRRSVEGFVRIVDNCRKNGTDCAAIVAHGGTIMSIMETFARPKEEYYHWQCKNGEGFQLEIGEEIEDDMDISGSGDGILSGFAAGRPRMALSPGTPHRENHNPGGKNYTKMFAGE